MSQPPPSVSAPPGRVVPTDPCEACGQPFELRAASCPRCDFPRTGGAPLSAPVPAKSPRSAMWLSLVWPGGGHFYGGDNERGAILTGASLLVTVSVVLLGPALGLLLWIGLALYAAIDSGRLVSGSRDR